MSKADYIKAYLDLLKLTLSAVLGFFLIVFWGVMQNESLIETMSIKAKMIVRSVIIIAVVLIMVIFREYYKSMDKLEEEP
jgi:cytosine/uracil/thiamine/allantoin permease